jgi:cytochrome c-type biogenesis protein CcmH
MRDVIRRKLAVGDTQEDIKAYFVEQYGQIVLGVPPKRGGMILAWVVPFLVVLAAGGWVFGVARRRNTGDAKAAPSRPLPSEYAERVERELEQFE